MHHSPVRQRTGRRNAGLVTAIVTFFSLLLAGLPVGVANAAQSPHAGKYTGPSSAWNGATVSLVVDAGGNLTDFSSQSYLQCSGFPTPIAWAGLPAVKVTAGVAFDYEWTYSDVKYTLENVVINLDGSASGQGYASMPSINCQGYRFSFTATLEGGVPAPVYDPTASVSVSELSVSELADSGVVFSGAGFAPSSTVSLAVDGSAVATGTADAGGAVSFPFTSTALGVGSHSATLSSVDGSASVSFTVVEDAPAPVYDPTASVSAEEITLSQLATSGLVFTGTGFAPNSSVTLTVEGTVVGAKTADASGAVTFDYTSTMLAVGENTANLSSDDGTASVSFMVVSDPVVPPSPPGVIPAVTPTDAALVPDAEGGIVAPKSVVPGEVIEVKVIGVPPGAYVGAWFFSTPTYLGTHAVATDGTVQVTIPLGATAGEHRIAVWAADGTLIGWTTTTVTAPGSPAALASTGAHSVIGAMATAGGLMVLGLALILRGRRFPLARGSSIQ